MGEGAVSYLAVLLFIGAMVALLVASGIPGDVTSKIQAAICRVMGGHDCAPATQADPFEPRQDCWTWIRDATVEGVVTAGPKVIQVRAGRRVTVTTRRVQHPDGTVSYDVIISPNIEVGANAGLSKGGGGIDFWAALQGTSGRIYSFNASDYGGNENKARDAASKFADKLWLDQAQNDALTAASGMNPALGSVTSIPAVKEVIKKGLNWLIGKTAPLTRHLPIIGDNIQRATEAPNRSVDNPDQSFIEGGPSVGWSGGASGQLFGVSTNGRGFANIGLRTNNRSDKYHYNYYFKLNGEAEVAPNIDLGGWIPKTTAKDPAAFEDWVASLERDLSIKAGRLVTLPVEVKAALQAAWPKVALSIKAKAARMYMMSTDKQGHPTQLRIITESQWIFSIAGMASTTGDRTVGVFRQTSIAGRKYNTQTILNLDGPENAENLKRTKQFLAQMGMDSVGPMPPLGLADFFNLSPSANGFDDYLKHHGQTYQQIWDSDVTTNLGAINGQVAKGYLLYEPETNTLTSAEYLNPDKGWLPWSICKVKR